jgi:DNA adenine methylase
MLKWVGGKSLLLPSLDVYIPSVIENYIEPFLGGGSVLFHVLRTREIRGRVIAADCNSKLINFYVELQNNPDVLVGKYNAMVEIYNALSLEEQKRMYLSNRVLFNDNTNMCGVMFLFMNKTCFRGMYRENKSGAFNVPFGNYHKLTALNVAATRELAILIAKVEFKCLSFADSLKLAGPGDFVYCDPPYVEISATSSFTAYSKNGFTIDDHRLLFNELCEIGVDFVLSNSKCEFVVELVGSRACIYEVVARRAINSKKPESKCIELIITSIR